jgi:DHA1 family bicyclomycin/chloramphenicol resistance-like MFS transporter
MRLLCGFGGSAGMVITRAIVRDLAEGHAAARLMSKLTLVMGAAPILAPTLGGMVLLAGGWQSIFWICAVYGALCCLAVVLFLPETLPENRRLKLSVGGIVSRYAHILRERGFITHALMGGCAMFGMFAFLGGSPAVFIDIFHLPPPLYGTIFGCCAAGFIVASQINPRILPRFGSSRVMRMAVRVFLIATAVLVVVAFVGPFGWLSVAVPAFFSMSCQGFNQPNTVVGALQRHAAHAGAASALMGTLQFGLASISGLAVGLLSDGTARPMALLMFTGAVAATICDLCRPKRP